MFRKFKMKHSCKYLIGVLLFYYIIKSFQEFRRQQDESAELDFIDYMQEPSLESDGKCEKRNNIVFLKTHKTAGSAIQNIIMRYGIKNNLTFALPKKFKHFDYFHSFNASTVRDLGHAPFNIICHHMKFDHQQVQSIMPIDSVYITIVREPGRQFESLFEYMWPQILAFQKVPLRGQNSIEQWLDNAKKILYESRKSGYRMLTKNPTFYDFGYDNKDTSKPYLELVMKHLSEVFDLVLIADHMDESLVLLADLLCCDLVDVVTLKINARGKNPLSESRMASISKKARRWNNADAAIFDFFNATLWRKVKKFGYQKMANSIRTLRNAREILVSSCIEKEFVKWRKEQLDTPELLHHEYNVSSLNYKLHPNFKDIPTCKNLVASETKLTKFLIARQKKLL